MGSGPSTKKPGLRTGLLQLDAIQTSRRPTCGERGASGLPLPATRIAQRTNGVPVPGQSKKAEQPESRLQLFLGIRRFSAKPWRPAERHGAKLPVGVALFDRRVMHRWRERLGVNGLIVVEAAAEHQRGRKHGKGQNGAHMTNPPKRDFRFLRLRFLGKD